MNSIFADAAGDTARSAAAHVATTSGHTLLTLVRRELWEHRALWICPLVVAVLLALSAVIGQVHLDLDEVAQIATEHQRVALFTIVQWALSVPLYLMMLIVLSFYLLDCLYAERKDRSILFWKSLPVSDGLTVVSKLLVALVVVPLGVFALALLVHLVFSAILAMRVAAGNLPAVLSWNTFEWFRTEIAMLATLVLAVAWYAPVAAYLLLVSAWARRSPFLWSCLPPVLAPILERIAFGTYYLAHFIRYRSVGIWQTLALGQGHGHVIRRFADLRPVGTVLDTLNYRGAFTDIDLWLGLAFTAALAYAAIRIRRYRDDT
jgi:ABC-2 type transport system permease protein